MLRLGELESERVLALFGRLLEGAQRLQLLLARAVHLLHLADLGLEGAQQRAVRGRQRDLLAELRHDFVQRLDLRLAVGKRLVDKVELILEGLALCLEGRGGNGTYLDLALLHGERVDEFRVILRGVLAALVLIAHLPF